MARTLGKRSRKDRPRALLRERLAASKRRRYRTFLSWTGNPALCGSVAEELVGVTLTGLQGERLWIPPGQATGEVAELLNRTVPIGPLDAAAHLALDPANPDAGFAPFAIEVKNVRSVIYPWDHETWDLLAKLGPFPEVLPILVARRFHITTFRFFKDIGALGVATRRQYFMSRGTARASIDPTSFSEITGFFGFYDAELISDTEAGLPPLRALLTRTLLRADEPDETPLVASQREKWRTAAPIVDRYRSLQQESLSTDERTEQWSEFTQEVIEAGLYQRGEWAPGELEEDSDEDFFDPDDEL